MEELGQIDRVGVLMGGRQVGTLAMTAMRVLAFQYCPDWLRNGFSISPLSLPLSEEVFIANPDPLDGVFGVFDDSLPDGWGRLLVDRTLKARHIDPRSIGPLARLSIVGSSGMGALEYEPETRLASSSATKDFDSVAEECAKLLESEYTDDLDALFALGGSSGGARPKILTSVDGEEWIIKFAPSMDPRSIGADEYRIARLADRCGIDIPETRLFPSKRCEGYFGIRRFDRVHDGAGMRRVHMASAGALLETSHRIPNLDYETLMRLTWRMTDSEKDVERLYRLMCFNVFIGNRDDHSKNFSYVYDEGEGAWHLSPAYDLTQNSGAYGEHATTVNGKGRGISLDDLVSVGVEAGIARSAATSMARNMRALISSEGMLATS